MAKDIILSVEEINQKCVASEEAVAAYKWAVNNAGRIDESDEKAVEEFVRNRNTLDWVSLREFREWLKKTADSIDKVMKHAMNVGTEEQLPKCAKWNKQSYTPKWSDDNGGSFVSEELVKKGLVTSIQLEAELTPNQVAKASGMTVEKIATMFPDLVIFEPKARVLNIK